jgi:MFS family permease
MRVVSVLLAIAAGLALADASVVTLALPELLTELDTSVLGVAAVIFAYTVTLAVVLLPAELLARRLGAARVAAGGFVVFAAASLACALADTLPVLLVARAVQAAGGGAGLVAVFALLHAERAVPARRLWLGVAVLGAAVGPALGGALTQAFDWRAIFLAQVPVAVLAALAALAAGPLAARERAAAAARPEAGPGSVAHWQTAPERFDWAAGLALALVSAALTAVLFLLVLLLVTGWDVDPLRAALAVTVLPLAALAGSRVRGAPRLLAAVGCLLVGLGTAALAFLPTAGLGWTVAPQVLAGLGMGMVLPALGGELLPERDARDAARLLTVRHAGIAIALVPLAVVISDRLDTATLTARQQGVALVLDARIDPERKLDLAPRLLAGVDEDRPRTGLRRAVASARGEIPPDERPTFDAVARRADEVVVAAAGASFESAFLITAALAGIAGLVLAAGVRRPGWALALLAAGVVVLVAQLVVYEDRRPAEVVLRDPCDERALPGTGGVTGFLQDRALELLDRQACTYGSSREELVLALSDESDARRYERVYGEDPRQLRGLLDGFLG